MLTMLFETGHPWITFKDACNLRSPQQHVGVVHGSNLCTEITLNTSADETAVCNLGSVNLPAHLVRELKALGLWDEGMVADLKYFDGSLAPIEGIHAELKARYATAMEKTGTNTPATTSDDPAPKTCSILDPDCEACQ
jgi:ribonucleotide reductase alpha subunit